jgi:tetratricopeptide (TPR) repeat protein
LAAGLIVMAGVAVYWNSFAGVFVFDDDSSISNNPTIREWWRLDKVVRPPCETGETVAGRPLLNFSLAVNYAISGTEIWSYHLVNLLLHLANALLLLALLQGTLRRQVLPPSVQEHALTLAFVIAGLWTVHPLHTEAVTYIVERAESLVALFYLLMLYGLLRSEDSTRSGWWKGVAVGACCLGMASKETMVTAPVMALLYDRTFLAGSFAEAWRRRRGLYLLLGASWLLLVGLVLSAGLIFRGEEFAVHPRWPYALTQPKAILHYLRLAVWPYPQCAYYAWPVLKSWQEILPSSIVVLAMGAVAIWALVRRPMWGFLGMWFFGILAPTSSIVPLRDVIVERRMYLPLVAVLTFVVLISYAVGRAAMRRGWLSGRVALTTGTLLGIAVAVALGIATVERNRVYRSVLAIWDDTVKKVPHNVRAQNSLGVQLAMAGSHPEAIEHFQETIRLNPDRASAHNNLANSLVKVDRLPEAIEHYQEAVRLEPDFALYHQNLGNSLAQAGRLPEAIEHYQQAVRLNPDDPVTHNSLGLLLANSHRLPEAMEHFRQAIRLKSDYASPHCNLGNALIGLDRQADALKHYQQALSINPDSAEAHNNLASALLKEGRSDQAFEHFQKAVRLKSDYPEAQYNLGQVLWRKGRIREAIKHTLKAARLAPTQPQFSRFAALLLAICEPAEGGDPAQAVELAEQACSLIGRRDILCLDTLAAAYASAGRFDEAVSVAKEAWQMAQAAGQSALAEQIHIRLQLYRDKKPYRRPVVAPAGPRP